MAIVEFRACGENLKPVSVSPVGFDPVLADYSVVLSVFVLLSLYFHFVLFSQGIHSSMNAVRETVFITVFVNVIV